MIYPNICAGCGRVISGDDSVICVRCWANIPRTYQCDDKNNRTIKLFWGRINVVHAFTSFVYSKGGIVQRMIHELKYKGNTEVGVELGVELAKEIQKIKMSVDVVIPVPLHPKKEKIRGYNQSLFIAEGIGNYLGCEVDDKSLQRTVHTESQTRKGKYERWENVNKIFRLSNLDKLEGKHVLLVDDVITTGATIEDCFIALSKVKGIKISVVALASSIL